jgi:hypothetical protein
MDKAAGRIAFAAMKALLDTGKIDYVEIWIDPPSLRCGWGHGPEHRSHEFDVDEDTARQVLARAFAE